MLPPSKPDPLRFKFFSAVSKAHQSISSEPLYVYIFLSFSRHPVYTRESSAADNVLGKYNMVFRYVTRTARLFCFRTSSFPDNTPPCSGLEASQMSESEPYLLVEKCGASRGKPIYVITKHIPSVDAFSRSHCLFHSLLSLARPIHILAGRYALTLLES